MTENNFEHIETGQDHTLMELGQELLSHSNAPRELIVLMRHWVLMRDDIRTGKYAMEAAKRGQTTTYPDPTKMLDYLREKGDETTGLGLEIALLGAAATQQQSDNALTALLEQALQKFSEANPSPEDINLLKQEVPELANKFN